LADEVAVVPTDSQFEVVADKIIDKYFAEHTVVKDLLEIEEKKTIIKELALANRKSEIIPKLNERRKALGLPLLGRDFDLFYYAREYALLVEDISLHYAANLAKKFRFANRITRISKLNDVAESVLERINARNSDNLPSLKEESLHNENIKLFSQLLGAIDEQMGKLHVTKLDVNVREGAKLQEITSAGDVTKIINDALRKKFADQLPASVEANFSNVTPYEKCSFAEEMTNITFCQKWGEQCKVQTGEVSLCPHFLNKVLMNNKEWMANQYHNKNLTVKQIADLAGCKEIDERVVKRVRDKLSEYGLYRTPTGTDK
jgi:hypothetical protein